MVKVLENVFGGIICSFAVIKFAAILKPDVCRPGGAQIWRPQISVTHVEEQLSSGKLHRSETQPGC